MKKFVLLIALFIGFSLYSQVSLKGYTLGEKLVGANSKETTVAGMEGTVIAFTLKDKRIFGIAFRSYKEVFLGYELNNFYQSDLDYLIEGIEKNYGIKLEREDKEEEYDENFKIKPDYRLMGENDGIRARIIVEQVDNDKEPNIKFLFALSSIDLNEVYEEELQSDF